jgi:hypothetical protein
MDAARRKATALAPRFHILLTTYDVAIKDVSVLRRFRWSALVLDEGHCLKGGWGGGRAGGLAGWQMSCRGLHSEGQLAWMCLSKSIACPADRTFPCHCFGPRLAATRRREQQARRSAARAGSALAPAAHRRAIAARWGTWAVC